MDQDEKAYRALVESTRPTLPNRSASLEEIYSHFGLSHNGHLVQQQVVDHLYAQIASAFRAHPTGGSKGVRLQTLKHQLLLRYFADDEVLQPYLAFLGVIMDAARANDWIAPPLTDELSWRTALTAAANCDLVCPSVHRDPDAMLPQFNQRQYAVACAIKRLRTLGYKVAVVGGQANIQRAEEVRIAEHIESQIRNAGGLEMAAYIFHSLRQRYDSAQERYHVGRRTGTDGRKGGPSAPVAYLLNLCAKNTGVSAARTPFAEAAAKDAFSVATVYAAAFDLEPYNTWETLFHSGSRLPHFLQEIAVYDGMFNLVQARPSVELLLYRHGVLPLRDGGEEYRLERKSRAVERVALSLLDFGAMQDRMVLSQVLDTVMTCRMGTPIPAYAAKIGLVQKNGEALLKQYNELAKLRPEPKAPAFMNCWFLSLNQLLVILDGVSSNDSFQKSLFTTRHIVMGSLDFYFEHAQALALKSTPGP